MSRIKLTKKTSSLLIGLIFLLVTVLINQLNLNTKKPYLQNNHTSPTIQTTRSGQLVKVKRVVDGDTIELETGQKVRYIGMDTPELHDPRKSVQCFGNEAMLKNKELVEGKTVRLEKDVSETDRYGRLLRFIYLENQPATASSLFINEYLVREGYARVYTVPPDVKFATLFKLAEQEAMEKNRGLWSKCQ